MLEGEGEVLDPLAGQPPEAAPSRERDCYFANTPSPIILVLEHLLKGEGDAAE